MVRFMFMDVIRYSFISGKTQIKRRQLHEDLTFETFKLNANIQGGPIININKSPFDKPSKNKFIMSFSWKILSKENRSNFS